MKSKLVIILSILFYHHSYAHSHTNKIVETIHSPDSRECTFFRLKGVTEADPVVSNNGWFSIPLSYPGHDVIVSMLLTSYTADKNITVTTTGKIACGHAAVNNIQFTY